MFRTTRHQGDSGVAAALAYYTSKGHSVSIPFGDAQRYDLIVDRDGELQRVQCKTTTRRKPSGSFEVQLATNGGNMSGAGKKKLIDPEEVDFVFILDGDNTMWEFPSVEASGKASMVLWDARRHRVVV